MASLIVLEGGPPKKEFKLEGKEVYRIGRAGGSDIQIQVQSVSNHHAKIHHTNGRYFIEDCDSKNGTSVNREPLIPYQPRPLMNLDEIKVCGWNFKFQTEEKIVFEEGEGSSTVHASIELSSHPKVLEAQPSEKLHALLKISNAFGKTLEEDQVISLIADILINIFKSADRCLVIFREEPARKLIPMIARTVRPRGESTVLFSRTIVEKVLDSGEALLFHANKKMAPIGDEPHSIVESRIRSAIVAPLIGRDGKAFGLIQLDVQDDARAFAKTDLNFLVAVANQAALALENARLHKIAVSAAKFDQDMQTARLMQRSFLPATTPNVDGYQFFAYYQPARNVGGDYYDFIEHGEGRMGIFVGDVAGKGVTAALVMAKLCAQVRSCMLAHADLGGAIERLNEHVRESGAVGRFVTLSAQILDPKSHRVTSVSAGHPSPQVYRRAKHQIEHAIDRKLSGLPLGIEAASGCSAHTIGLEPGDCVIAYTDGISEAGNAMSHQFTIAGIRQAVLAANKGDGAAFTPQQIGERIIAAVAEHQLAKDQDDDIALVCYGRLESHLIDFGAIGRATISEGPITQTLRPLK